MASVTRFCIQSSILIIDYQGERAPTIRSARLNSAKTVESSEYVYSRIPSIRHPMIDLARPEKVRGSAPVSSFHLFSR